MKNVDVIMCETLSSGIGPVQTIKRLIRSKDILRQNGYEIEVFTKDNMSDPLAVQVKKKYKTRPFMKALRNFVRFLAKHSYQYGKFRLELGFKQGHRLVEFYNALGRTPDIIVFHSIFDCYEYHRHFEIPGVKTVLFTHSDGYVFEMAQMGFPQTIGTKYEKELKAREQFVMERITMNACIAKVEEKNLLAQFPVLKGKTSLVVNGIDDLKEKEKEEVLSMRKTVRIPKYRMICVGGVNGRKGQWMVIEALGKLDKTKRKDVSFTVIGDGQQKSYLEKRVQELGLTDIVKFAGHIPNDKVYTYLAKANIFVLMSALEGLPIALLEAMRCGLALIATNVSGIPELIEGKKNGLLLNNDLKELTEALNDLELYDWDQMGAASRTKFEKEYTFERMRRDYISMLNKVSEQ